MRRTGLVLWHKPNSVPAFARWRSFISLGFPSAQLHPAPLSGRDPCKFSAGPESGAGWSWVRLLPEGFFPHPREKRAGNPPSALSCTTWGFSCGSAYANARWALTPPFHPYPAPSSIIQHHPAPLSAGRKTCSGLTPDLKVVLDGAGMVLDGAGRYIFCDTVRHPGFTSWAPPISRGMLPFGVRTFLWQNKCQASDHPPQERVTQSESAFQCRFRMHSRASLPTIL